MKPTGNPPKEKAQQGGQHGEGNYQATRDYERGLHEHLRSHDVEREARDAAPHSPEEQREMDEAERIGREKSRGEDETSADDSQKPLDKDDRVR